MRSIKADEAVMKRNDDSTIEFAKMYDEDTFPYSGKKLHDRWARLKKSLLKDEDVEKLKLKSESRCFASLRAAFSSLTRPGQRPQRCSRSWSRSSRRSTRRG